MPKTDTREKIWLFISDRKTVRAKDIYDAFGLSPQIIHRHLKKLLEEKTIIKKGRPPKVFYSRAKRTKDVTLPSSFDPDGILNENWITIQPDGTRIDGEYAFYFWCLDRGFDYKKKFQEYKNILKKYDAFRKEGLIDATGKFTSTFSDTTLKNIFYLDFFSYEVFGRTKWGQLVLHAKLSEDRHLMQEVFSWAKPKIEFVIQKYDIDEIGFIPHSLRRKNPFLPELKKFLHLSLPEVPLQKVLGDVVVAQKTLKKSSERIENARETIILPTGFHSSKKRLLLVDDAVGSGATLHETAKKCKHAGFHEIYGLALVGSIKGFEVIAEV